MEDFDKKTTESDNGTDIIVASQNDNAKSDNQPNWTWGRKQDMHYKVPSPPPDISKFFHKSGWDYFWEFLKIGLFFYLMKILKSCLF